jgi:L-alanine-DL-glutamate epimerase-like enolase superfamily enzyme
MEATRSPAGATFQPHRGTAGTRETVLIEEVEVSAFKIPTDAPESDGTYAWDSTTMVLVEARAGGQRSLGYTYASTAAATLIRDDLEDIVCGRDALSVKAAWQAMVHHVRNIGRPGIASMAISAVDTALWDLKARLLELPLVQLFGQVRDALPIYGSGGFTSYSDERLQEQLGGWVEQGIPRVKMKIGRHPDSDPDRVAAAREAVGEKSELFVDANGAYSRKQAMALAWVFSEMDVSWFEEPVSSDDLDGLQLLRDDGPPGMDIAAGEYGFDLNYFERMLDACAVDVLQADATRCGGFTGFLQASTVCEAHHIPLSAHCAPALHLHVGCAASPVRHAEYFHDHVRIENMLLDGVAQPENGALKPDLSRPGIGFDFKHSDAERYRIL